MAYLWNGPFDQLVGADKKIQQQEFFGKACTFWERQGMGTLHRVSTATEVNAAVPGYLSCS